MTDTSPLISLIICTRNRAEGLRRTLASVSRLSFQYPWELVIVNNGSTDHTANVIKQYVANVHHSVVSVSEVKPGLSCARNAGIVASRGRLIAFTDDDCYPNEDYLRTIHAVFADRQVDYFGGRVLLHDPADLPVTTRTQNRFEHFPPGYWFSPGTILGANMVFKRECLSALGGFDERLGAGSFFRAGEDTDLLRRLSWHGFSGCYDPSVLVYHHHGRKTSEEALRLRNNYSWGRGAVFVKSFLYQSWSKQVLKRWYYSLRPCAWGQIWRELLSGGLFLLASRLSSRAVQGHKGYRRVGASALLDDVESRS